MTPTLTPDDWLGIGFPPDTHRVNGEYRDSGQFQHQFYLDLGSIIVDDVDEERFEQAIRLVNWCRDNVNGDWAWVVADEHVHTPVDDGDSLVDVRKILWISFDLSEDAMLSRMTWFELKGIRDANRRGMSKDARCNHMGHEYVS